MKSIAQLSYQRFLGPPSNAESLLSPSPSLKPAVTFTTVLIRLYHLIPNIHIPKITTITVPIVVRVLTSWLLGFASRRAAGTRGSGKGGFGGASGSPSVGVVATGSACLVMRKPPGAGAGGGVGAGAADDGGKTTRTGAAAPGAGAGAGVGTAVAGADIERKASFAWSVASAPHAGQFTGAGIRPLTGSTSNLNFVP